MEYQKAIEAVEAKLLALAKMPPGYAAKIYDYALDFSSKERDLDKHSKERPYCGIRVAEVSFHNDRGGSSYMQVDVPYGLLTCAAVERILLALVEDWEDEEIEEEWWRLERVIEQDAKAS